MKGARRTLRFEPVVAEIMSPDPSQVSPRDFIRTAAREMKLCSIRHLPVVDDDGTVVGILSQRDVLTCDDPEQRVAELMSQAPLTVKPETPAHEAAYLLVHRKIGCLPVVSAEGLLVGIVTESDFVSAACVLLGGRPVDELEDEEREADRI